MRRKIIIGLIIIFTALSVKAQDNVFITPKVPAHYSFFSENEPLEIQLYTDLENIFQSKGSSDYQPVSFDIQLDHTTHFLGSAKIKTRGNTRRKICKYPPLKLNLKESDLDDTNKDLEKMDIVMKCDDPDQFTKFLFKEFLAYKLSYIVTEYSYQVRLLQVKAIDEGDKIDTHLDQAFLVESDNSFEKRTNTKEAKKDPSTGQLAGLFYTPDSNYAQIVTRFALFQYMIGNTDWGLQTRHNVKIFEKDGTYYPVAYDFDYSGLVNADYAIPSSSYDINSVTERFYMGPRVDETVFNEEVNYFLGKRSEIEQEIMEFNLLSDDEKAIVLDYIRGFYNDLTNGTLKESVVEASF